MPRVARRSLLPSAARNARSSRSSSPTSSARRQRPSEATRKTCALFWQRITHVSGPSWSDTGARSRSSSATRSWRCSVRPVVHEDDPERAVRAALAVRDRRARGGCSSCAIGGQYGRGARLAGRAPARGGGDGRGRRGQHRSQDPVGAPINGVLVGETTYRATAHLIEYREAASIDAKGKAEPVVVWEAIAPRSRFGSDVELAPLAALVGRQREVDVLRDALTRAREEREPQLVTLVGVPGIGKSRLVAELLQIVGATPELITWRQGRCLSVRRRDQLLGVRAR